MARRRAIGLTAAAMGVMAVLAGCQSGYDLPSNQKIVVQLRETTGENPAEATVNVDGNPVFGPGEVAPGEPGKNIVIHDPAGEPKLTPGKHRISWTLKKNGMPGKVGSVELRIFAGATELKTQGASTSYVMPMMPVRWWMDINISPAPGGPADKPPAATRRP